MNYVHWFLVTILAVFLSMPAKASAAAPLRAKVLITQTAIPQNLNERKLIAFAKSHNAKRLQETKDVPVKQRRWFAEMVVAFNSSPADLEYHALFFDVTGGGRRFVDDMAIMVSDKAQRTFLQKLKLKRPQFEPGRVYEIVVTVRRNEVGKTQFETTGDFEQRSGRVDFDDKETR
jgi:hypothetical protein